MQIKPDVNSAFIRNSESASLINLCQLKLDMMCETTY